jgi:hypothetical protein
MSEKIDLKEYEELFPYSKEFDSWVLSVEEKLTPGILVQRGRDRFSFEYEGIEEEFSPYNTYNS